jgi:hypothetical protein
VIRGGDARLTVGLRRLRPALVPIALGALLALIPAPTCILRLALGVPCPACGLTRAALALAHLDLALAQRFHPLGLALTVLAAATTALAFLLTDAGWRRLLPRILGAAGVALILVWALRFTGLFGGPAPY